MTTSLPHSLVLFPSLVLIIVNFMIYADFKIWFIKRVDKGRITTVKKLVKILMTSRALDLRESIVSRNAARKVSFSTLSRCNSSLCSN